MTKKVTISFDDGPEPDSTHAVLDTLAEHNVKSSFFSICSKLSDPEARAVAERAVAEGHWYGSHSHFHKTPMGWMDDFNDAIADIDLGFDALGDLAKPRPMYRPFGFGGVLDTRLLNPVAVRHLLSKGYQCVLWDFTPREWRNEDGWVEMCLDYCRQHEWSCLALRDSERTIGERLDLLLLGLKDGGFEIVQDFPSHVVPISDGEIMRPLTGYVAGEFAT